MKTLRSLALFGVLYAATVRHAAPLELPALGTALCLAVGFLAVFPVDRLRAFLLWGSESLKLVRESRTCVISSPWLKQERRDWRFIGHVKQKR